MVSSFWLGGVLICILIAFTRQKDDNGLVYHTSGNVSILGIFNTGYGSDCSVENVRGYEEMAAAIWTVEALNNYNYIPGLKIGLSILDVCDNLKSHEIPTEVIKGLLEKQDTINVGILTTREITEKLKPLESFQNRNIVPVEHVIDTETLTDLVVQLLTNLQWMSVRAVLADSQQILNAFGEKTSRERIYVRDQLLIDEEGSWSELSTVDKQEISPVIVVMAPFANLTTVTEKIHKKTVKLILVPTDFVFAHISDFPNDTIVLLPPAEDKSILSRFINNPERHRDFFRHRGPTKSPLFIGTAAGILKLAKGIKKTVEKNCTDTREPCAVVVDSTDDTERNETGLLLGKDVETILNVLKIEPRTNDEMFLYITVLLRGNATEDLAIFQIFSWRGRNFNPVLLMINDDILSNRETTNKSEKETEHSGETLSADLNETEEYFRGKTDSRNPLIKLFESLVSRSMGNLKTANERDEDQSEVATTLAENVLRQDCDLHNFDGCQKFDGNQSKGTKMDDAMDANPAAVWRFLTWVSINTAMAVIGVLCTLSIIFFVLTRMCRGYVLEGSPCFLLSLTVSVILVYVASLPFHIELPAVGLICGFRANGPPVVFSLLFSLLLSRSFMLAFSRSEGRFVSHINGYLQSVLFLFMFGVQVSITSKDLENKKDDCSEMDDRCKMLTSFSYDFILLILLVSVSPFIIRLKRNYKEGLLFALSAFLSVVVWAGWISFYLFLPNEHKEAAVAIGLNLTATVLLLCVLIPRTYFLAGSDAPDKTIHSLPYLDRNILADVSGNNYKLGRDLNEPVFGTITYRSCERGVSNPNFCSDGSGGHRRENTTAESVIDITPDTPQPN